MTPRLRDCGNPACRICRWNRDGYPPDSGHPVRDWRPWAGAVMGTVAIVALAVLAFVLLPVLL